MPLVKYLVGQIIYKPREADVLLWQGQIVKEICGKLKITTRPALGGAKSMGP